MDESPLISCIVPLFNQGLYVAAALDSILAQTYRPLEIIVVDDGSTDNSAAVAAGYGDRIRYVYQSNKGQAAARNHGAALARGEYLAFLDADDLWLENKLALQMALMQAKPDVDICLTFLQNFWIDEMADEAARLKDSPRAQPLQGYVFSALLTSVATFERVGQINERFRHGETPEWLMRAAEMGLKVEVLPDILTLRRYHRTNITRVGADATIDEFMEILKRHLDHKRGKDTQP